MVQVLIVEDDPDIASLLRRGLAASGYGAVWAETAEAATALVEAGGIDAAIVDMMLGADSGAALLADLRRRGHRMPALILSALARVEDRAEGLDAGAHDYIVKPFQLSELIARLEVQLRRSAPRDEPVRMAGLVYDPQTRVVAGGPAPGAADRARGRAPRLARRPRTAPSPPAARSSTRSGPRMAAPPRTSSTSTSATCAASSRTSPPTASCCARCAAAASSSP